MEQKEFSLVVSRHEAWLRSESDGLRADLSNCTLNSICVSGRNLKYAIFSGAQFNCCHFDDCSFAYADFTAASFNDSAVEFCNLTASNFYRTQWQGGRISSIQEIDECSFIVSSSDQANFDEAVLSSVNLAGEYRRASFDRTQLEKIIGSGVHISGCSFNRASFNQCDFRGSKFEDCWFEACSVERVNFDNSNIESCDFTDGSMKQVSFIDGSLVDNGMARASLTELDLSRCHIVNMNNAAFVYELDHQECSNDKFLGANFFFTDGPLPGCATIEWSDDFEMNIWALRC